MLNQIVMYFYISLMDSDTKTFKKYDTSQKLFTRCLFYCCVVWFDTHLIVDIRLVNFILLPVVSEAGPSN